MAINIESDLKEILLEIKSDIKELKKDMSAIKTELAVVQNNQDNFKDKLADITGTQKAQIWSLITLLDGTLISITIAYFRTKA